MRLRRVAMVLVLAAGISAGAFFAGDAGQESEARAVGKRARALEGGSGGPQAELLGGARPLPGLRAKRKPAPAPEPAPADDPAPTRERRPQPVAPTPTPAPAPAPAPTPVPQPSPSPGGNFDDSG